MSNSQLVLKIFPAWDCFGPSVGTDQFRRGNKLFPSWESEIAGTVFWFLERIKKTVPVIPTVCPCQDTIKAGQLVASSVFEWRKPSGKVELLIITQMSPFFDKRSGKAERRTSWLYLASPFTLQRLEVFVYIPNYWAEIFIYSKLFRIFAVPND